MFMTMPAREEKEPAQIAAGTLPRAIEVNAIEDWTVDGTREVTCNVFALYALDTVCGIAPRDSRPELAAAAARSKRRGTLRIAEGGRVRRVKIAVTR